MITIIRIFKVRQEDIPKGMTLETHLEYPENACMYREYIIPDDWEYSADSFLQELSCISSDEY